VQAVEARVEAIGERPKQFPRVRSLLRRAMVKRFPYAVFFIESEPFISIVAVLHHARDPKHWQSRKHN
jgi:plasmid stabilization system protein ParE